MTASDKFAAVGIDLPYGASGNIRLTCPKCTPHRKPHNQRRKDLSVDVEQGLWHCHHCAWSGSTRQGEKNAPMSGERLRDMERIPTRKETYADPRPLPPAPDRTPGLIAVKTLPNGAPPNP